MARVVPETQTDRIGFYRSRIADWTANAAALGLDPLKVAELSAMVDAAFQAHLAREAAESVARAATQTLNEGIRRMHGLGSSLIQAVRAQAAVTGDLDLYVLALLPIPDDASPVHPETPHGLTFRFHFDGSQTLKWRGSAKGGYFTVHRLPNGNGPLELIGATSKKSLLLPPLPAGASFAAYQDNAHKGARTSPASAVISTPSAPLRLAA
jgi:hypothetical protein